MLQINDIYFFVMFIYCILVMYAIMISNDSFSKRFILSIYTYYKVRLLLCLGQLSGYR